MTLELILDRQFIAGGSYKLPEQLQANRLVLQVESAYLYQQPGTMIQDFYFPELGLINGSTYFLKEGIQLIKMANDIPYELTISALAPFHIFLWSLTMPLSNPSTLNVLYPTSATATPTTVAAPTPVASVALLAANSNRKGAAIWNNSTGQLYVELGSVASTAAYTAKLEAGGYYEVPFGYTGAISGIWSNTNGNALVREFV